MTIDKDVATNVMANTNEAVSLPRVTSPSDSSGGLFLATVIGVRESDPVRGPLLDE